MIACLDCPQIIYKKPGQGRRPVRCPDCAEKRKNDPARRRRQNASYWRRNAEAINERRTEKRRVEGRKS